MNTVQKRDIKIVGIGGSYEQPSRSLQALQIAMEAVEKAGVSTEILDVRALNLPIYDTTNPHVPDSAAHLRDSVFSADGLIWCSPLYHGTVSGAFKNVIDWLQLLNQHQPPYLTNKVVGLISTAGGTQGIQAINTMEFMVRSLRGFTLPFVVPVGRVWQAFNEHGRLHDDAITKKLHMLGKEVVNAATKLSIINV